jgi:putative component of toxin-antitoxin plasmid stabilization module
MTGIRLAREPLSKHQAEGILELRSKTGTDIIRILFFFEENIIIVATNGFAKKQQNIPFSR